MTDERTRRVGLNEAMFRTVNEQIESMNKQLAAISDRSMHIVCECGDAECMDRLVVELGDYERVRADAALFFLVPGHEVQDLEDVAEEGRGRNVVRKKEPGPADLARKTDPRS